MNLFLNTPVKLSVLFFFFLLLFVIFWGLNLLMLIFIYLFFVIGCANLSARPLIRSFIPMTPASSVLSECRRVFVLFCPIIIQTISLPCSLPLQGAEGTQPLLCLLTSSYILLGFILGFFVVFFLLFFFVVSFSCPSYLASLIFCLCLYSFVWNFHVCIIWAIFASLTIKRMFFYTKKPQVSLIKESF